jgi:hypothetical protein
MLIGLLLKNGLTDGPEAELAAESISAYGLRAFSENPPRETDDSDSRGSDPPVRIEGDQLDDEANDSDGHDLYRGEGALWDSGEQGEQNPSELGEDGEWE